MKHLFIFVLLANSLLGLAQNHTVGINGGINKVYSWDGKPPFGEGSPYYSKLGSSVNLTYTLLLKNNVRLSLNGGLNVLNFQIDDFYAFTDDNNQAISADFRLSNRYYSSSLGGGYLFNISDNYAIGTEVGAVLLYRFKQVSYSMGYPDTRIENDWPWKQDNRYYGMFLAMDHSYRIYRSKHYRLYLTGALRVNHVIDFNSREISNDRILPELTLGVAVTFGKQNRGRF